MASQKYKRTKRSYSPTGRTVRAALDFTTSSACFKGFGSKLQDLPADELQRMVIELFEDRKVVRATFSMILPKEETARQPFIITFTPMANGCARTVEINIKSVDELRAKAKMYKADATAYSEIRKPRIKFRNIDKAL